MSRVKRNNKFVNTVRYDTSITNTSKMIRVHHEGEDYRKCASLSHWLFVKYDMAYKRFRHIGLDKVKMDFAFFAIAFNLKKMCSKIAKQARNGGTTPPSGLFVHLSVFISPQNRIFWIVPQKSTASKSLDSQAA